MKPKSIHVVQRMAPGGIETLVLELAEANPDDLVYSLAGHTEELVRMWPALRGLGDRLVGFDARAGLDPLLLTKLRSELVRRKPGSVVLHHIGPLVYGGLAARLAGVKSIIHVEHDAWHYANSRHRALTRFIERVLSPIHVAVSEQISREVHRIVPRARIDVIRNGVNLERFAPGGRAHAREQFRLPTEAHLVGAVGRLVAVKAHANLVRAIATLSCDVHLVIAGEGPERSNLEALARDCGLSERLHLLGHRDDVAALLPAFDVFCLPSLQEGFPRSLVEAQAAGVPVVASDVGGVREAVCPLTGHLVPAGDVAALAVAVSENIKRGPGISPRAFVERSLSWRTTLAAYRELNEVCRAA